MVRTLLIFNFFSLKPIKQKSSAKPKFKSINWGTKKRVFFFYNLNNIKWSIEKLVWHFSDQTTRHKHTKSVKEVSAAEVQCVFLHETKVPTTAVFALSRAGPQSYAHLGKFIFWSTSAKFAFVHTYVIGSHNHMCRSFCG